MPCSDSSRSTATRPADGPPAQASDQMRTLKRGLDASLEWDAWPGGLDADTSMQALIGWLNRCATQATYVVGWRPAALAHRH